MTHGFFWLHIKKSAGQSTRAALGPLYTQTDRQHRVPDIRALPPQEWNDALNNFRNPLGPYTFRRCAYAEHVLWPGDWNNMVRLGFAREPVSRAVSMFDYLFQPFGGGRRTRAWLRLLVHHRALPFWARLPTSRTRSFDLFLEALDWQAAHRGGPDPAAPIDLHFSTHTNPMALDVLDDRGAPLLSHLVRLERFEAGIDLAYDAMGLSRPPETRNLRRNEGRSGPRYAPTPAQIRRLHALYAADFDLYANAIEPAG